MGSSKAIIFSAFFALVATAGLAQDKVEDADLGGATDETPAPVVSSPPADAVPADADDTAAPLKTADQAYSLRVSELEGRINELKEQIFRSKAKLTLLTEQVTGGLGGGAQAVIVHNNEISDTWVLREAHYFLDGAPIWQKVLKTGLGLSKIKTRQIFDGNLVEGSHTLTVRLVYVGASDVFKYMKGYKKTLKKSYTFTAEPGKVLEIRSVGFEKGDWTTEATERPDIRFDLRMAVEDNDNGLNPGN